MTQSMIEKCARAAHEAHKAWCDYTYPFDHEMASREVYFTLARAVLQALREPDEATLQAGKPNDLIGWRAMIDHILNESGQPADP